MKSIYYTAVTTRAYRKAIDALEHGDTPESWDGFRQELFKVSRREYSTGFYFSKDDIEASTNTSYNREYLFLGSIGKRVDDNLFELDVKNQILSSQQIEYIGPDVLYIEDADFRLFDENRNEIDKIDHGKPCFIKTDKAVGKGFILRRKIDQPTQASGR
jgi:putative protease